MSSLFIWPQHFKMFHHQSFTSSSYGLVAISDISMLQTQKLWDTGSPYTVIYSKFAQELIGDVLHHWTSKLDIFYRLITWSFLPKILELPQASPLWVQSNFLLRFQHISNMKNVSMEFICSPFDMSSMFWHMHMLHSNAQPESQKSWDFL